MNTPTPAQWTLAESYLPNSWTPPQTAGEVWAILDAVAKRGMRFHKPKDALHWFRGNADTYQVRVSAIFVNGRSEVWIGDPNNLSRPVDSWVEVSLSDLEDLGGIEL